MRSFRIFAVIILACLSWNVNAQHDHHNHGNEKLPAVIDTAHKIQDSIKPKCNLPMEEIDYSKDPQQGSMQMHEQKDHAHSPDSSMHMSQPMHAHTDMHMPHAFSRSLPMSRNASGTGWMPDESPMHGYMFHSGGWNMMLHGNIYPRYTNQDVFNSGTRGGSKWDAPNWIMLMANRETGKRGLFNFNLMMSADPLTEGSQGYPLLFQSGETYQGSALVNRQHPHDLFSELSIGYTHMVNEDIDVTVYAGYPGEPALGPPAFMHRTSAENIANAPLGHHWQDATHITFGVATLGVRYKMFKIEGSSFTGREPDENRYNFDEPRFDSYSYRLSFNPSARWSMQVSNGFIKSPELLEPGTDIKRTTASVLYTKRTGDHTYTASTAVWGMNRSGEGNSNSFLVESNRQLQKYAVYGRYEYVQKSPHELALRSEGEEHDIFYNINALTVGANRIMWEQFKLQLRLGLQTTLYKSDKRLASLYGEYPVGAEVYLRINHSQM
jgi:hypothetical protein